MMERRQGKYRFDDDVWDAVEGTVSGLALALLSGVAFYFAFPPSAFWPLAWIALVPEMIATYRTMPRETAFLATPIAATTFFALHYQRVSVHFAAAKEALSPVMRFVLQSRPTAFGSVFIAFMLVSLPVRRFHLKTSHRFLVLEPVLFWMGIEYFKDASPSFGTSASFAYSQYAVKPLVNVASLTGALGVTGVIVAVNAAIAALILARTQDGRGFLWHGFPPPAIQTSLMRQARAALAVVALLAVVGTGMVLVPVSPSGWVTVGLVQPGQSYSFEGDGGIEVFTDLTWQAALSGAKVVVWPEALFHHDPRGEAFWPSIQTLARETGCYLVVPYFVEAPGKETPHPRYINEGILLSPGGEVVGVGAKDHPMTILGETSVTRGTYPVFSTPGVRTGIMICYDLNFSDTARRLAVNGAQLLCVPSNDWKAISQAQSMYAVFRAAESGASLIKADTYYDSCIVSFDGTVMRKAISYAGMRAVLVADVPLRASPPPAVYIGSLPGLLAAVAWCVMMASSLRGVITRAASE